MMPSDIWRLVVAIGGFLTLLAVLPYLLGLASVGLSLSMETASVEMMERVIRLGVGMLYALVPLSVGGVILFALFTIAEANT